MWKLKIAEGGSPWLRTLNNHVGRQVWEFDPNLGSPEELAEIERARVSFSESRFEKKHSSDLLMRIQVTFICIRTYMYMYMCTVHALVAYRDFMC
jgi:cycloartenol synthase